MHIVWTLGTQVQLDPNTVKMMPSLVLSLTEAAGLAGGSRAMRPVMAQWLAVTADGPPAGAAGFARIQQCIFRTKI